MGHGLGVDDYDNDLDCHWDISPAANIEWEYKILIVSTECRDEEGSGYNPMHMEVPKGAGDWLVIDGRRLCGYYNYISSDTKWNRMEPGSILSVDFVSDHLASRTPKCDVCWVEKRFGFQLAWRPVKFVDCLLDSTCSLCENGTSFCVMVNAENHGIPIRITESARIRDSSTGKSGSKVMKHISD